MKKIESVKKDATKWIKCDIKKDTLKKVQDKLRQESAAQNKDILQREFLDDLINKRLEA